MSAEVLLIWILVGAIAGWLASKIVSGGGLGLIGDIAVGIIGAFIGGWLLPRIGVAPPTGIVGEIIVATIGAIVLLLIIRLVRRI